jgi:hypothetical protein
VTTWREDDGALRDAYQAAIAGSPGECAPDDVDRVWEAVAGRLDVDRRRDLIDRMAGDPALAQAWRVAVELDRARGGDTLAMLPKSSGSQPRPPARWLPAALMGLAATLIVAAGIRVILVNRAPADTFRTAAGTTVQSRVASDALLPRDAVVLRWSPGPGGSRYSVRVTTEDLKVLTTASDLTAPEFTVPRDRLGSVPSGGRVLWQVVLAAPGGETVSSQTFVVRVQ